MHEAFLAGVRWADADRTFVVVVGRFRAWLDVEDTAYFVTAYEAASGEIELSDRTREPLAVATLSVDVDDVLRCTVKGRFAARFRRDAQADLLAAIEQDGDGIVVCAGNARLRAPGLDLPS